jgi:hypothetical protein
MCRGSSSSPKLAEVSIVVPVMTVALHAPHLLDPRAHVHAQFQLTGNTPYFEHGPRDNRASRMGHRRPTFGDASFLVKAR